MKIFFGMLLLFIGMLMIPVSVFIKADPNLAVSAGWLFFKCSILPSKDTTKTKPKKTKKEKPDKPKTEKKKKKLSIQDLKPHLKLLLDLLASCLKAVQKLLKRTTLAKLSFEITVVGDDAAAVATRYGTINTAVYNAIAILDRVFTLKMERINIIPDFSGDETAYYLSLEIRTIPLAVLAAGLNIFAVSLAGAVKMLTGRKQTDKNNTITQERAVENGKQSSDR